MAINTNIAAVIYVNPPHAQCKECYKAIQLCETLGIPYIPKELSCKKNLKDFRRLFPNEQTVPQILFRGFRISGYYDFEQFTNELLQNGEL